MKRFLLLFTFLSIIFAQNIVFANNETDLVKKTNRIDNYEILTISQPGSLFYSVTNGIIKSAINLNSNLTFIGRANVGLEKIVDKNNVEKLTTKEDYLYSISIKTIHNDVSNLFYSEKVSESLLNNEIIISELTANLYSLKTSIINPFSLIQYFSFFNGSQ